MFCMLCGTHCINDSNSKLIVFSGEKCLNGTKHHLTRHSNEAGSNESIFKMQLDFQRPFCNSINIHKAKIIAKHEQIDVYLYKK